jgi:phosphoribosyl-AMP cyclohydrolase
MKKIELSILFVSILIGLSHISNAQLTYFSAQNVISVVDGNHKIVFAVELEGKEAGYKKNLEYFWFKAEKIYHNYGYAGGKLLDGDYKVFEKKTGKLLIKGAFKRGLKDGEWIFWNSGGQIIREEQWRKGQIQSETEIEYYPKDCDSILIQDVVVDTLEHTVLKPYSISRQKIYDKGETQRRIFALTWDGKQQELKAPEQKKSKKRLKKKSKKRSKNKSKRESRKKSKEESPKKKTGSKTNNVR